MLMEILVFKKKQLTEYVNDYFIMVEIMKSTSS